MLIAIQVPLMMRHAGTIILGSRESPFHPKGFVKPENVRRRPKQYCMMLVTTQGFKNGATFIPLALLKNRLEICNCEKISLRTLEVPIEYPCPSYKKMVRLSAICYHTPIAQSDLSSFFLILGYYKVSNSISNDAPFKKKISNDAKIKILIPLRGCLHMSCHIDNFIKKIIFQN